MGTNDRVLGDAEQFAGNAISTIEPKLEQGIEHVTIELGLSIEYQPTCLDDGCGALTPARIDEVGEVLPGTCVRLVRRNRFRLDDCGAGLDIVHHSSSRLAVGGTENDYGEADSSDLAVSRLVDGAWPHSCNKPRGPCTSTIIRPAIIRPARSPEASIS